MDKDTKRLIKDAEAQGFTVTYTSDGHPRFYLGGTYITTMAGTPSDKRGWKNSLARLRRAGYRDPKRR